MKRREEVASSFGSRNKQVIQCHDVLCSIATCSSMGSSTTKRNGVAEPCSPRRIATNCRLHKVSPADKKAAEEVVLSDLGSKHKVKRYDITIDKGTEMKPEEVTDLTVSFKIGA